MRKNEEIIDNIIDIVYFIIAIPILLIGAVALVIRIILNICTYIAKEFFGHHSYNAKTT